MLNLIHETDGDSFDKKMTCSYLPLITQPQCHNKPREGMRRRVFLGRENMPNIRPELFTAPGYWLVYQEKRS
ncbi:hypothetical protein WP2S18C03_21610 [Aeromonas veronii]|nr:hypothetical protein WP2S18C03_21610 [Aeromonas veronii]